MNKRLTVAHYKEDLSWLKLIPSDITIYTYHKLDNDFNLGEEFEYYHKINYGNNEFGLRNVGRESHTYLKHIVDNYDDLFDLEYFSQGLNDHAGNFIDLLKEDTIEYKHVSDFYRTFESINGYVADHMKVEGYETRQLWDMLFTYDPPDRVEIVPHAMFKVPKEIILMHPKQIYEKCLDVFKDNDINNANAWNFEYFWQLLFNDYHKQYEPYDSHMQL